MISPLVYFPNYEAFEIALREEILGELRGSRRVKAQRLEDTLTEARRLRDIGLPPIASALAFGTLFGVSPKLITAMATRPQIYWRSFNIPKKSGGSRTITAPRVFLKTVQTYILKIILAQFPEHPCAFGFSKGRGALSNAQRHLHRSYVWNTDIFNFFPTLKLSQVQRVFNDLGFRPNVSWILASLCTYRGLLPQGAPSSPKLSNIICLQLDNALEGVARSYQCTYSRYADDITLSSQSRISPSAFSAVEEIVQSAGFLLNHAKTRLQGPNQARYVTGFVVNEKLHPDRATRRTLRAKFYAVSKGEVADIELLAKVQGWASYVHSYDPKLGREYLRIAARAIALSQGQ